MRIVDFRTGSRECSVSSEEEVRLGLSAIVDSRIRAGLGYDLSRFVHPDDIDAIDTGEGFRHRRDEDDDAVRVLKHVAAKTPVLGAAVNPPPGGHRTRRILETLGSWLFEPFTVRNTLDWPVRVAELRSDAALADAGVEELARHLNVRLREDVAAVLRECADYLDPCRERDGRPSTLWEHFGEDSGLYDLTLAEVTEAVVAGPVTWDAVDQWRAGGGVDGDPFTVCRYAWGPLRASVQLEPRELLELYLRGDVDLRLHRMVADYGEGRTEFIWPEQARACCGQSREFDGSAPPVNITRWGRPGVTLWAAGRRCRVCGAAHYGSLLTCRPADGDAAELPLGVAEPLDALPAETLTAIARDGIDAIAEDLPVS